MKKKVYNLITGKSELMTVREINIDNINWKKVYPVEILNDNKRSIKKERNS